jgi:hypothetical protein
MGKEELPEDWNIVTSYKKTFNSEEGERVLSDLKRQARFDSFSTLFDVNDEQIKSLHILRCIINYIEYMKDRELPQRPEEILDVFPINEHA